MMRGGGLTRGMVSARFTPRHISAVDLPARRCTTATMRLAGSSISGTCHARGANGSVTRCVDDALFA